MQPGAGLVWEGVACLDWGVRDEPPEPPGATRGGALARVGGWIPPDPGSLSEAPGRRDFAEC